MRSGFLQVSLAQHFDLFRVRDGDHGAVSADNPAAYAHPMVSHLQYINIRGAK
jgi:hypothetical protein